MATNTKSIYSVGLLIGGATIGAGILGLPIQTGIAGVFPSLIGTIGVWILLTLTAFIISDKFTESGNFMEDFPTVFRKEFGIIGKILVIAGYLINYYGIMIAYLCASTSLIAFLLPIDLFDWCYLLIFFIPAAGITLFGLKYVLKANSFFMIILILSFIILGFLIFTKIDSARYSYANWKFFPFTLPIIVNAFLFHNIIPAVCRTMENDRKKIKMSILVGTVIACIINLVWIIAVLGALPLHSANQQISLQYAYDHNQVATVPLAIAFHTKTITILGVIFSFCAIITSFVSVVIGLQGFLRDIFVSTFKIDNKIITNLAVFIPPLLITLAYPNFFLKAMGFAGGVGGLLIFGVFPSLLWLKTGNPKKVVIGFLMLIFFVYIMTAQLFFQNNKSESYYH